MSDKINVQEILKKHGVLGETGNVLGNKNQLCICIEEIVEAVVDKCWQKSRIHVKGIYNPEIDFEAEDGRFIRSLNNEDDTVIISVDKQSIEQVKKQIDYLT